HDYAGIEIGKKEWLAGLATGDAEYSLGFFSQYRVGADFVDIIDGREVAASLATQVTGWSGIGIYTDTKDRKSYVAVTPINAAGINQADTIPESKLQDVARDGINEIYAIKRLGIYCVIFGRSMSVVYRIDEQNFLASVRNKKGKGTTGYFAVYGNGQEIWWLSDDGVYYINESTATTILSEPIRDKIQNISDKAGAIIGFDNDDKVLYLYADTTMYIYDYKAQQWRTYEQSSDWKWLTPNLSNKMLATDGTDIYELQPKSGSTGTLTARFRSPVFNVATHLRKLEIDYSTNVAITITAYDERNSSVPLVKPLKLLPNRDARAQRKQLFDFNIKSKRLYFDIDATWNTATQDWEIGQIRGLGDPKPILKQE
ncbi:MAG: hypothetical protein ACE5I1_33365, partial [bacterium]